MLGHYCVFAHFVFDLLDYALCIDTAHNTQDIYHTTYQIMFDFYFVFYYGFVLCVILSNALCAMHCEHFLYIQNNSQTHTRHMCICTSIKHLVCVCLWCVCVCVWEREGVCVCLCVYERERERKCVCVREREKKERACARAILCVHFCARAPLTASPTSPVGGPSWSTTSTCQVLQHAYMRVRASMCVCVCACVREFIHNVHANLSVSHLQLYPIYTCMLARSSTDISFSKNIEESIHKCMYQYIHTHVCLSNSRHLLTFSLHTFSTDLQQIFADVFSSHAFHWFQPRRLDFLKKYTRIHLQLYAQI